MYGSELHHIVKGNDESISLLSLGEKPISHFNGNPEQSLRCFHLPYFWIDTSIPPEFGFHVVSQPTQPVDLRWPCHFWGIPMLTRHRTFIHQALCPAVWVFYDHLSSPDGQCWDGWLACDSRLSRFLLVLQWMYHKKIQKISIQKTKRKRFFPLDLLFSAVVCNWATLLTPSCMARS